MPFTASTAPKRVRNVLPNRAVEIWVSIWNGSVDRGDSETTAFKKAWSGIQKGFKKVRGQKMWVRRNPKSESLEDLEAVRFPRKKRRPSVRFGRRSYSGTDPVSSAVMEIMNGTDPAEAVHGATLEDPEDQTGGSPAYTETRATSPVLDILRGVPVEEVIGRG